MTIQIDGSIGEGGGQVLRSSLTLSLVTGKDLHIKNIRARRKKPGLRAQHLQAVRAAVEVGSAQVEGDEMNSRQLTFRPGKIKPGRFRWEIGTAGSSALVLQTVALPLSRAVDSSTVTITGGTHVRWSPSFQYLSLHWLHFLAQMGIKIDLDLERAGYYPEGGGEIEAKIHPAEQLSPLTIEDRGRLVEIRGISAVSNLDRRIAERQRNRVLNRIGSKYYLTDLRIVHLPSHFKGTMLLLLAEFENSQCCYFALGELGKSAELVADEAVAAFEEFMETDGAIDHFLADQLLLPLAFARGESRLRTSKITQHLITNAEVIQAFLPVHIEIQGELEESGLVLLEP